MNVVLQKRKFKLFLIFIVCSGLAWFISKLSETYTSDAVFDLEFVNIPNDFLLIESTNEQVDVKLTAVGFQFLAFNVQNKKINIDLSKVEKMEGKNNETKFFMPYSTFRKQIENQLPKSMVLYEMAKKEIYFDLLRLATKEILVKPKINYELAQNYLLDGELHVEPSKITIKGPLVEIDTIRYINTDRLDLNDLTSDFSRTVNIQKPLRLAHTTFSVSRVLVSGKVARFSEKQLEVPIQVTNLPVGLMIRTFPDQVSILVRAKIDVLKNIKPSDFQIIADYSLVEGTKLNMLSLKIGKQPTAIHSAVLEEKHVEFILNKE